MATSGSSLALPKAGTATPWYATASSIPLLYAQGLGALPSDAYAKGPISTWGGPSGPIPQARMTAPAALPAPTPAAAAHAAARPLPAPTSQIAAYKAASPEQRHLAFLAGVNSNGNAPIDWGSYVSRANGGRVKGRGTGRSDSVKVKLKGGGKASLSNDEYVIPADVVAAMGDGSSEAGANALDQAVMAIRSHWAGKLAALPPPEAGGTGKFLGGLFGGSEQSKVKPTLPGYLKPFADRADSMASSGPFRCAGRGTSASRSAARGRSAAAGRHAQCRPRPRSPP
jgi:hypothetical protein